MANLLESELASCVGISERWWYDEIYSRCCEDIERDDEKIGVRKMATFTAAAQGAFRHDLFPLLRFEAVRSST
jgi:hypothetical protein